MLSKIASMIGMPCGVDRLTEEKTRLSCAQILIEIDDATPLKDYIMLKGHSGVSKKQVILYEFRPFHYTKCLKFGHLAGKCG